MLEQMRHALLSRWAEAVSRHPRMVLLIAALLTVACIGYSVCCMGFRANRNELVSPELSWNKNFIRWQQKFIGESDFWVVIDAGDPAGAEGSRRGGDARQLADDLGQALQQSPWVASAMWRFQPNPKLLRIEPIERVEQRLQQMADEAPPLLRNPTPQDLLLEVQQSMLAVRDQAQQIPPEQVAAQIEKISRFIDVIARAAETPEDQPLALQAWVQAPDDPDAQEDSPWTYLTSRNQRLLFIRVTPRAEEGKINALEAAIQDVRRVIAAVAARYPEIEAGLTGIEVVESDETRAASFDTAVASTVSFVLILGLLSLAYHSFKMPLLAMISISAGIAWAFGFVTGAIGYLQVLSVIFTPMLLGISDAFGIHLAARFEMVRHDHPDTREGFVDAMRESFQSTGPAVLTGAVTTAVAFLVMLLTDFDGVAQMGLISGVGIILCLLAMFSVFPALLRLVKPGHRHIVPIEERELHVFREEWFMIFSRHPKNTIAVTLGITLLAALAATQLRFNYDLMELQPRNIESVQWQSRAVKEGGQSIWSGVSVVPSLEEARQRTEEFRRLSRVAEVGGIAMLFPEQEELKVQMIQRMRQEMAPALAAAGAAPQGRTPDLLWQLSQMRDRLQGTLLAMGRGQQLEAELRQALEEVATSFDRAISALGELDPPTRTRREQRLQIAYGRMREHVMHQVAAALDPSPLRLQDLPEELMKPYVGHDRETGQPTGEYALEIFPRLPDAGTSGIDSALHPRFLPFFIRELQQVDPQVTGVIAQIYWSGDLIKWSFIKAGIYAFIAVFILVFIDFRSLTDTLLALMPVVVGFVLTFGLLWVLGQSINPANIMVLPLMFGVAVDCGVHLLHTYRQDPQARPLGLSKGTGKGVAITTLTALIGFATLMLARHRGIASLGMVMSIGLALTLVASLIVMPACLELRQRLAPRRVPGQPGA